MRPVPLLAALTLSLLARLSAAATTAAPGIQSAGRVPKLSGRYTEMEPSAMFSEQQLLERPTRAKGRRLAARASAKPLQYDHVIEIRNTNGNPIGLLNHNYVLTTDPSDGLAVAVPSSSPGDLVFASSSSRNTVGLVVAPTSDGDFMKSGSANFLVLTNSEAVAAGSDPTESRNDYNDRYNKHQKGETAVWQYKTYTNGLEVHWTNPDKTTITMKPVVDDKTNYAYLPYDRDRFRSTNSGSTFIDAYFHLIPIPKPTSYGYTIAAYDSDKTLVGYFDKNYVITKDQSQALAVALPNPGFYNNLKFAPFGRNSVGLVVGPLADSDTMKAGSANSLILTNSETTPAMSDPVIMGNDYNDKEHLTQRGESAVWGYDPQNHIFDIRWINPDFQGLMMHVLVQDVTGYPSVVGDVEAFKAKFGDKYRQVTLKLEGNFP